MDATQARERLELGLELLRKREKAWDRRRDYFDGKQDLPYAPEGVNQEYLSLREQSVANWLKLAMIAPVQRLRADGFRTGRDKDADTRLWAEVWQPNKWDSQQRLLYVNMMVHDLGIASVWPNQDNPKQPLLRVENGRRVWLNRDVEDPQRVDWSVKWVNRKLRAETPLWTPQTIATDETLGWVYDDESWFRFTRPHVSEGLRGEWKLDDAGGHPLEGNPFVPYTLNTDEDGNPHPSIDPLMPQQDAINTIRFNTLLAMQFSAYRQRVFTGYDPVVRDSAGQPMWQKASDGVTNLLDSQGQPIPVVRSPGRIGVDRALVFPGHETKVYDLDESNLANYVTALTEFLGQFFATGQVPPQYLLTRMANLSGDALAGAESTLQALVADLKVAAGESHEEVMRRANKARGDAAFDDLASEVIWGDAEARSFAQTVDAIVKLISTGFPKRAAFEMIPGATLSKVDDWMSQLEAEAAADPLTRQVTDELARRRQTRETPELEAGSGAVSP